MTDTANATGPYPAQPPPRGDLSKLAPWVLAVLGVVFSAGGAYITVNNLGERIDKSETIAATQSERIAELQRDNALLGARVTSLESSRAEINSALEKMGVKVDRINLTVEALCQASPPCRQSRSGR